MFVAVQIAKRSELHTFKVVPQPWVVDGELAVRREIRADAERGVA